MQITRFRPVTNVNKEYSRYSWHPRSQWMEYVCRLPFPRDGSMLSLEPITQQSTQLTFEQLFVDVAALPVGVRTTDMPALSERECGTFRDRPATLRRSTSYITSFFLITFIPFPVALLPSPSLSFPRPRSGRLDVGFSSRTHREGSGFFSPTPRMNCRHNGRKLGATRMAKFHSK